MTVKGKAERRARALEIIGDPELAPPILRRCVINVLAEKATRGAGLLGKFTSACDICLAGFVRNGLVHHKTLELTPDGKKRNAVKAKGPEFTHKNDAFKRVITKLQNQQDQK